MTTFSDLRIFENPEINSYLDRLYHYLAQHFGCAWPEVQNKICITGSVARVLSGIRSEETVKDLDLTTGCPECFDFLAENAVEIFGVLGGDLDFTEDKITVQTPFILIEIFFNALTSYQIVKLDSGILLKIF